MYQTTFIVIYLAAININGHVLKASEKSDAAINATLRKFNDFGFIKRTKDFSTLDFKDSKEIKGGAESNEVITNYIESGEFDVIDGTIFPRTHYIDQNGMVHSDRKIFGIIVKLKPVN